MTKEEVLNQVEVTNQIISTCKILFPLLEQVNPQDRDKVFDNLISKLTEQKKTGLIYHFPSDQMCRIQVTKVIEENEKLKKELDDLKGNFKNY